LRRPKALGGGIRATRQYVAPVVVGPAHSAEQFLKGH
jgi:hypothetical protein